MTDEERIKELEGRLEAFEKNEEYVNELQERIRELEEERDWFVCYVREAGSRCVRDTDALTRILRFLDGKTNGVNSVGVDVIRDICEKALSE